MIRRTPIALVVDDNAINRDLLDGIFEQIGWKAVLSESGEQALDVLRSRSVDLVLLDLRMPDLHGNEVCRRIRSELGLTSLPVVACTAHGMSEDRDRMLADGFDELTLGTRLGLGVVAEGVESLAELQAVWLAGCTQAQGFVIARPMRADKARTWLRKCGGLASWLLEADDGVPTRAASGSGELPVAVAPVEVSSELHDLAVDPANDTPAQRRRKSSSWSTRQSIV